MMLDRVLVLNLSLLVTHQIDAAYWHEWDMFAMPGGIQLFNAINLLTFLVLLGCAVRVLQRHRSGFVCSLVIAGGGMLVLPVHTGFALAGYTQFDLPLSVVVIVASMPVALWQLVLTFRYRDLFDDRAPPH